MENFPQNTSKPKKEVKKILIILLLFLAAAGVYIYNATYYVMIRFDELGPLTKNMSVYYNGFKIGKIVHIGPDKDFKHTLVRVNLKHSDTNLPQNTTVHVESFPNGERYLQFVYPNSPSFKMIQRGDILEGIAPYSIEKFMLGQNISGVTDVVSIHVIQALNSTEIANQEIKLFFQTTSKIAQENRAGIRASVNNTAAMTKSLAQMAENLNRTTKKLNDALEEKTLQDTTSNIKDTTSHIAEATKDIGKTIENIDATISQTKAAAENLNSITSGLNETLGKKFGGMRVMFGAPVKSKNCVQNACN